ncbi:MAG: GGDEF domain-containing protein [Phycisphaerae bacterium]|nr:GGDEF domain-containing protein [Phycisphaerae bacterium]
MSQIPPVQPPQGRRRRTIVVRNGPGVADVAQSLRRLSEVSGSSVAEVDDVYDALAAIYDRRVDEQVTLALPVHSLDDAAADVADSARRLDPGLRIVLLAPRGFASADLHGLDEVVFLPASMQDLAAAFGPHPFEPPAESAEVRGEVAAPPRDEPRSDMRSPQSSRTGNVDAARAAAEASTARREPDMVELVIDDALQAFAARRSQTTVESSSARPADAPAPTGSIDARFDANDTIGDIDLTDAVVDGGDRFVTLAAELVRRELGAADVRIVTSCNDESTGAIGRDDAVVPIRHRRETLGHLVSRDASADALAPWADWLGHWLRLERTHAELRILAWTDELTGAGNRRAFERVLEETITTARPERRPVSLMYFDIDNFKSYNDRFGHEAGDEVLRETVELLRSVIRRGDHVFRIGGDEFVVIFADSRGARTGQTARPGTPGGGSSSGAMESVETIAQRFRECVSTMRFPQLGLDAPGTVSISAGVATFPWDGHDMRSLLAHADQLALQSKRSGKNTITFGPGAKDHCCDA